MLTLQVADLGNGTGALATVAGSSGAAVTINGALNGGAWNAVGSRVGDGTITLAVGVGGWWFYAEASGNITPPAYVLVTDEDDGVDFRCMMGIAARIGDLDLPLKGIYTRITEDSANVLYPSVQITGSELAETELQGLNDLDKIGYPLAVLLKTNLQNLAEKDFRKFVRWRERIARAFREQRIPGVPESHTTLIEPLQIVNPQLPMYQHCVTGLILRCVCYQTRGI